MKYFLASLFLILQLGIAKAQFPVTITISPAGSGTVTAGKNGSCSVGTNVIQALDCIQTPQPGYTFKDFSATAPVWCVGTGTVLSTGQNECGAYAITGTGGTLTVNYVANSTAVTPPPVTTQTLFCAKDTNPSCGELLSWNIPASPSDPIVGYQVFRASANSSNFVQLTTTSITTSTYTDKTIDSNSSYQYYVVSVDSEGIESSPSNTTSVTIGLGPSAPTPASPSGLTGSIVE